MCQTNAVWYRSIPADWKAADGPHAGKSATYDTYPARRFRRSQGRFRGNRAALEVSARVTRRCDRRRPAMVSEAEALHKRSLSETAHTPK